MKWVVYDPEKGYLAFQGVWVKSPKDAIRYDRYDYLKYRHRGMGYMILPYQEEEILISDLQSRVSVLEDTAKNLYIENAKLQQQLDRFQRDYALFEEVAPPDMPRATFVKWCYEAWEKSNGED